MKKFFLLAILVFSCAGLYGKTPVIGISGSNDDGFCVAGLSYIASVTMAGGLPVTIPVTNDDSLIEQFVGLVDGLVMTGGEDFAPLKGYGQEPLKALGKTDAERDEFDLKLLRAAVAAGKPILGICRGCQAFAVAFGGSLWQDIPSQVEGNFVKHRQSPTKMATATHSVTIERGSCLSSLLGGVEKKAVNSAHHQAMKDVPAGLKVVARSADGIVEAVERCGTIYGYKDGGAWILGLQFHPEELICGGDSSFLPVFQELVRHAQ